MSELQQIRQEIVSHPDGMAALSSLTSADQEVALTLVLEARNRERNILGNLFNLFGGLFGGGGGNGGSDGGTGGGFNVDNIKTILNIVKILVKFTKTEVDDKIVAMLDKVLGDDQAIAVITALIELLGSKAAKNDDDGGGDNFDFSTALAESAQEVQATQE